MGETKKAKPWAVIALALAGGALAVDKFILPASADEAENAGQSTSASTGSDASTPVAGRGPSLAARFERFDVTAEAAENGLSAAFEVPKALRDDAPLADLEQERPQEIGLRLSSILTRDGERLAVVNGRPLRVGDSVGGATLVRISEGSVTLDTAIGPVVLDLARPSLD